MREPPDGPGRPVESGHVGRAAAMMCNNGAHSAGIAPSLADEPRGPGQLPPRCRRFRSAAYKRSWPTSSPRWRWERPPIVFDGEIRHWVRILFALTRPYLGTARIMSNAFADMT